MVSVESGPYKSRKEAADQRKYEMTVGKREMERKGKGTVESVTMPYARKGKWYITSVYRFKESHPVPEKAKARAPRKVPAPESGMAWGWQPGKGTEALDLGSMKGLEDITLPPGFGGGLETVSGKKKKAEKGMFDMDI
jgi:hypothetical protein